MMVHAWRSVLCLLALSTGFCAAVPTSNVTPGIPNLRVLPSTVKGSNFHKCLLTLSETLPTSMMVDLRINSTMGLLTQYISPELAEQVAAQMTEAQVDAYCDTINDASFMAAMAHASGMKQPTAAPSRSKGKTGSNSTAAAIDSKLTTQRSGMVNTADFDTPFTTDPVSTLYNPHSAEYPSPDGPLIAVYAQALAVTYPRLDGKSRSYTDPVAFATISCTALDYANFIITSVCGATGASGTFEGVGLAGTWQAPIALACYAVQAVSGYGYKTCKNIVDATAFIDGLIDSSEIQGAYENGVKALDNQLILWKKVDSDTDSLTNLITTNFIALTNLVNDNFQATQSNINFTRDSINNNVNFTRASINNNIDSTRFVLRGDIANALAVLRADIINALTGITSQICDVKTDIARVQRETNYIRSLLLVPESERPGYKRCFDYCPAADPAYCSRPNATYSGTFVPYQDRSLPVCIIPDKKCKPGETR